MKSPRPIMCSSPESDNCLYMFQSGSKYYIWNTIEGGIWEIITSMDLVKIVTQIAKLGLKALKIAKIYRRLENVLCAISLLAVVTIRRGIVAHAHFRTKYQLFPCSLRS